jgi:hypothetical protein
MTHEPFEDQQGRLNEIVAADEARPSIWRQMVNGVSGLVLLLLAGLIVVLLVLWKAP